MTEMLTRLYRAALTRLHAAGTRRDERRRQRAKLLPAFDHRLFR